MTYLAAYDWDTRLDSGGSSSGGSRRGGEDPCCPPGYDPAGVWPRNSGLYGAPPDYRSRGAPMESPSPNGGRLKDDFCDCIPIRHNGRYWRLGVVKSGRVELGPLASSDLEDGVWVEVASDGETVVSVPGRTLTTGGGTPATGGGGTGGGEPTYGGGGTEDDGSAGPEQCNPGEEWVDALGFCLPGPTDGGGSAGGEGPDPGPQVPEGGTSGPTGGGVPTRADTVDTNAGHGVVGYLLGFILAAALTARGG